MKQRHYCKSFISSFFVWVFFTTLIVGTELYANEKEKSEDDGYINAPCRYENYNIEPYQCCGEKECSHCTGCTNKTSCDNLVENKFEGECCSKSQLCCREDLTTCYRTSDGWPDECNKVCCGTTKASCQRCREANSRCRRDKGWKRGDPYLC